MARGPLKTAAELRQAANPTLRVFLALAKGLDVPPAALLGCRAPDWD